MSPLSDGYKPPRLVVPPGVAEAIRAIEVACARGERQLSYETDPARRRKLKQLIDRAKKGEREAVNTLWALGPVDRNRYTPSGPNYLAREEAYQKQQRENAAALAVARVRELYNS